MSAMYVGILVAPAAASAASKHLQGVLLSAGRKQFPRPRSQVLSKMFTHVVWCSSTRLMTRRPPTPEDTTVRDKLSFLSTSNTSCTSGRRILSHEGRLREVKIPCKSEVN